MKWIKKVSSVPLTVIAKVIDSLSEQTNERTNAPSIRVVRTTIENTAANILRNISETAAALSTRITNLSNDLEVTNQTIAGVRSDLTALDQSTTRDLDSMALAIQAFDNSKIAQNILAEPYYSSITYQMGMYCQYNNKLYYCCVPVTVPESFDPSKWAEVTIGGALLGNIGALFTRTFELTQEAEERGVEIFDPLYVGRGSLRWISFQIRTSTGSFGSHISEKIFDRPAMPANKSRMWFYFDGSSASDNLSAEMVALADDPLCKLAVNPTSDFNTLFIFNIVYMTI